MVRLLIVWEPTTPIAATPAPAAAPKGPATIAPAAAAARIPAPVLIRNFSRSPISGKKTSRTFSTAISATICTIPVTGLAKALKTLLTLTPNSNAFSRTQFYKNYVFSKRMSVVLILGNI